MRTRLCALTLCAMLVLLVACDSGVAATPTSVPPQPTQLPVYIVVTATPGPTAQSSKVFHYERYDVTLTVNSDGSFDGSEKLVHSFDQGTFRGGFRYWETNRLENLNDISVAEVSGGQRQPYRLYTGSYDLDNGPLPPANTYITREDYGKVYVYWFFPPTNSPATRAIELKYHVTGGIRIYPDGDQLWWEALPPDRSTYISASQVTFNLLPGVDMSTIITAAYPNSVAEIGTQDHSVIFAANSRIGPNGSLEARVQWPHGLVPANVPGWQASDDAAPAPATQTPLIIVVTATPGPTTAVPPTAGSTPTNVAGIPTTPTESAHPPTTSPAADQSRIVFAYEDKLATINADGSDVRVILSGTQAIDVRWSPDHARIAYLKMDGDRRGLYTINADGSNNRELIAASTAQGRPLLDPIWSPDGSQIAYTALTGNKSGIWRVAAGGGKPEQIAAGGSDPNWSPDGQFILFSNGTDLLRWTPSSPPGPFLAVSDLQIDWLSSLGTVYPATRALLKPSYSPSQPGIIAYLASGTVDQVMRGNTADLKNYRVLGTASSEQSSDDPNKGTVFETFGYVAMAPRGPLLAYEVFTQQPGRRMIRVADSVTLARDPTVLNIWNSQQGEYYEAPSWNADGTQIAALISGDEGGVAGLAVSPLQGFAGKLIYRGTVRSLDWVSGCRSHG